MKHIKQHPLLGVFYLVILVCGVLYLNDYPTTALYIAGISLSFVFGIAYWNYCYESSQKELISNYNADEIGKLKEELATQKWDKEKYRTAYMKAQTQSGKYQNENINLKSENEKLLLNVKELEKELTELKTLPSSKAIEFIADQPDIPEVHFGGMRTVLDSMIKLRVLEYLNSKEDKQ